MRWGGMGGKQYDESSALESCTGSAVNRMHQALSAWCAIFCIVRGEKRKVAQAATHTISHQAHAYLREALLVRQPCSVWASDRRAGLKSVGAAVQDVCGPGGSGDAHSAERQLVAEAGCCLRRQDGHE